MFLLDATATPTGEWTSPAGFDPGAADLPAPRTDIPPHRLARAALIVVGAVHGMTPEEVVRAEWPERVRRAVENDLECREASDWVSLLAEELMPQEAQL